MEKLIQDIKVIYDTVQTGIEADKTGASTTNELRSAAVKLGAAARHIERHIAILKQAAAAVAPQAASAPATKATPAASEK